MRRAFPGAGLVLALLSLGITLGSADDPPAPANPDATWIAEDRDLLKVTTADGEILFGVPQDRRARAIAADPARGTLWAYRAGTLVSHAPDGAVRLTVEVADAGGRGRGSGADSAALQVDGADGGIWLLTGAHLHRFGRDGGRQAVVTPEHRPRHMALDPERGHLWVTLQGGAVVAYGRNGEPVATLERQGHGAVAALAFDAKGDSLWVAAKNSLMRYSAAGAPVAAYELPGIRHLAADHAGGLWAATRQNLTRFEAGARLFEWQPFTGQGAIDALVADPSSGAAWVTSPHQVVQVTVDGEPIQRLTRQGRPGRIRGLALFADVIPPELAFATPDDGSFIADRQPELAFDYSDLGSGIDPDTLAVERNGEAVALTCEHGAGEARCVPEALPEAALALTATVADHAGNVSEPAELAFTVDVTPPEITLTGLTDGDWTNQPETTLTGEINEPATLTIDGAPVDLDVNRHFAHAISLAEGQNPFDLVAVDRAGNTTTETVTVILDTVPPAPADPDGIQISEPDEDGRVTVTGDPGSVEPHSQVTITNTRTGEAVTATADGDGAFTAQLTADAGDILDITVTDRAGNASEPTRISISNLPPDPATVAPPLTPGEATTTYHATRFLYEGANPIQRDVADGAIEPERAAVVRGRVLDGDGHPMPGAEITVLDHPELGHTLSRADGRFDLVVNGGGRVVVLFEKDGHFPAQRPVQTTWDGWFMAEDVILIQPDDRVTRIDLTDTSAPFQIARGNPTEDADGQRQATLLFPAGTTATLRRPDGSEEPLEELDVRATEYTVGETGPAAMPAPMPPQIGYTYAVELSVDQVLEEGFLSDGRDVAFSQPVPFYVDNFLDFPAGEPVPTGYLDRTQSQWVPYDNGLVVEILSIEDGRALLDVTGSGEPATEAEYAELGITPEEQAELAALYYEVGHSLWRVALDHFSSWDCNWPYGPPEDAEPPEVDPPERDDADEPDNSDEENECPGCVIYPQSQSLGEKIPVAGTPFTLNYRSSRAPGARINHIEIPLSGDNLPASLEYIALTVEVAGQRLRKTFPAQPNQSFTYEWDGLDGFGRERRGAAEALITVTYVYPCVYYSMLEGNNFGDFGNIANPIGNRSDCDGFEIPMETMVILDSPLIAPPAAGNWSLSVEHMFSTRKRLLLKGAGRQRTVGSRIIETVAGDGSRSSGFGDGGPAFGAYLSSPSGVSVAPDGAIYIADSNNHRIRRIGTNGIITTIAGTVYGFGGDGGPATEAQLANPSGVALSDDGSLYIADSSNHRVRKVGPDGIIETVAGSGSTSWSGGDFGGDGGPATEARLNRPRDIAIGEDGSIYIADTRNHRIRRVGPNGIIDTGAGAGGTGLWNGGFGGDGGPAEEASLDLPAGVAVGKGGSIYIADTRNHRIRRVSPNGIIDTVAGSGSSETFGGGDFDGDGGPAEQARLNRPMDIGIGADGSVYIADLLNYRVRQVWPDGTIETIAGIGERTFSGDGGPAIGGGMRLAYSLALAPDGNLYVADRGANRVRRLLPAGIHVTPRGERFVPSADGDRLFVFSPGGQHLRTEDAHTGETLLAFQRDEAGNLVRTTDGGDRVTTIERDSEGRPEAIAAPDGQRTKLTVDDAGHLTEAVDPTGARWRMAYTADGLMTRFENRRGFAHTFEYDSDGRLVRDLAPNAGGWELARTPLHSGYRVTMTSGEGRISHWGTRRSGTGERLYENQAPDGTVTRRRHTALGREIERPDGTVITVSETPDPRFGMGAPYAEAQSVTLPSGLARETTRERQAEGFDANDPAQLATLTETVTHNNGRNRTTLYERDERLWTIQSPADRTTTIQTDDHGRPVEARFGSLTPTFTAYDERGRPVTLTEGEGSDAREVGIAYDDAGEVAMVTDGLGRTTQYTYDPAGRATEQTLPDGRTIAYAYDPEGNLRALTPPGRSAHVFDYDGVDQRTTYEPPELDGIDTVTRHQYNRDRELTAIERPDGETVTMAYDGGGRLTARATDAGVLSYGYDPETGQLVSIDAPGGVGLSTEWDGFLPTAAQWTGPVSGRIEWTYDNNFWLTQETVGGEAVTFDYDADGLLTRAGALSVLRDPAHGLVTGTDLAGITGTQRHNDFGELAERQITADGADLYSAQYERDALGRITEKTETVDGTEITETYTYDEAGRLTEVRRNGTLAHRYTYDANGNRTQHLSGAGVTTADYDAQDRLIRYGDRTYSYNAAGDLTEKTAPEGTTTYDYDATGNLRQVQLRGGIELEYLIDGQDRRVGRIKGGELVTGWLYRDQLNPVAQTDGAGTITHRFVYAEQGHVPAYMVKDGQTYRLITDHLGSVRLVVNAETGAVAQRIGYSPYGKVVTDTNPGFQPFTFAGGLYDPGTGLVRFGARDYDPQTGRWTAKDPIDFAGGDMNLYGYVLNDPVNGIDPEGLLTPAAFWAIQGAIHGGRMLAPHMARGMTATSRRFSSVANTAKVYSTNVYTQTTTFAVANVPLYQGAVEFLASAATSGPPAPSPYGFMGAVMRTSMEALLELPNRMSNAGEEREESKACYPGD